MRRVLFVIWILFTFVHTSWAQSDSIVDAYEEVESDVEYEEATDDNESTFDNEEPQYETAESYKLELREVDKAEWQKIKKDKRFIYTKKKPKEKK